MEYLEYRTQNFSFQLLKNKLHIFVDIKAPNSISYFYLTYLTIYYVHNE